MKTTNHQVQIPGALWRYFTLKSGLRNPARAIRESLYEVKDLEVAGWDLELLAELTREGTIDPDEFMALASEVQEEPGEEEDDDDEDEGSEDIEAYFPGRCKFPGCTKRIKTGDLIFKKDGKTYHSRHRAAL